MAEAPSTGAKAIAEKIFFKLARAHVAIRKPLVIAVAGSVGKTSTKLALFELLRTEKRVSCMDDSYNNGLGLYLSVFELKVPTNTTVFAWSGLLLKALWRMVTKHPEVLIVEYGIDHPGDMDIMTSFIKPDISLLTAATPEHMEFMKTIDAVGEEEMKSIRAAKQFGIINTVDVNPKYRSDISTKWYGYGDSEGTGNSAYFAIKELSGAGATVDFFLDEVAIKNVKIKIVSVALIRQLTGATLLAVKLGISEVSIRNALEKIEPAAGRMRLLSGVSNSLVIDDTANFSPVAGIVALKTLKSMPTERRIAILGNMHELGEFISEGYASVGEEFSGIDILVLVGELSRQNFGSIAINSGFIKGKTLFFFDDAPSAGVFVRDEIITDGDAVLVKGPFGGFYLEEAVKKLLNNQSESKRLTRQSDFWLRKKRELFGELLDK